MLSYPPDINWLRALIDQLWLWLIKGYSNSDGSSTPAFVVTAFPDHFNGAHDSANIYRGIIRHLERGRQPSLRKSEELIACIVETLHHILAPLSRRRWELHDR